MRIISRRFLLLLLYHKNHFQIYVSNHFKGQRIFTFKHYEGKVALVVNGKLTVPRVMII